MVYAQLQVPSACMNNNPARFCACAEVLRQQQPAGRRGKYAHATVRGHHVRLPSLWRAPSIPVTFSDPFSTTSCKRTGISDTMRIPTMSENIYQLPHFQESRLQQVWWKQREFVETNQPVSEEEMSSATTTAHWRVNVMNRYTQTRYL